MTEIKDAAGTVKEELKLPPKDSAKTAKVATPQAAEAWEKAKEAGRQAVESVAEQAGHAARIAQGALHQARDRATEGEHQLEDLVRRSPLSAVLICLGLGFLIAFLWKRRIN